MAEGGRIIVRRTPGEARTLPASLHPIVRRVLATRGIVDPSELDLSAGRLLGFDTLRGIEAATALLHEALDRDARILVVGDYDADGATATALALRGLRALGATQVDYLVPNRFEYGYGLTPEIVALATARRPDLLITVDNGIASIAGVRAAKEAGIQVLITDHHLPGAALPDADAIVNPNQPDDAFPSKALAGVGVMFYLLLALRAKLRASGWFATRARAEPNFAELLDLVAVGTVADVVALDGNNRILVAQGLKRIRAGRCCAGIVALLQAAGRDVGRTRSSDIAFTLGPRLNAAGRLADMAIGIETLLSDDPATCQQHAQVLEDLNRERRAIEREMRQRAEAILATMHLPGSDPAGVCLFDESWHEGVVGILASRIKDQLHRPVIAFAPGEQGQLKGSARSIPGVHVRDALATIAARQPDLLHRFGGHAMAAGLSIARDDLAHFRALFDATVRDALDPADATRQILSDGALDTRDFTLDLARSLREVLPWGQGCPEPRFDGEVTVLDRRIVGSNHLKLRLRPDGSGASIDAMLFNAPRAALASTAERIRGVYRLDINDFRGVESLQLLLDHIEAP
ncbi:MAG: single-stranded-DNA-specific exonuclease RecJ [Gammaproteobacteria bacterium]|nr:single-stranded-DNA-specific exonuclease RecJ [Gammaproteobacteria bacterium]